MQTLTETDLCWRQPRARAFSAHVHAEVLAFTGDHAGAVEAVGRAIGEIPS